MTALFGLFMASCSEQDIMTFGEERMVYFDKFWKDAPSPGTEKASVTGVTFFFAEDDDQYVYGDLVVVLAGRKPEHDLKFKLRVVDDMTTAEPSEYTLEDEYTFRAMPLADNAPFISDTLHIKINRSPRLETQKEGYDLTLEIVPNEEVGVGQYERSRAVLHITKDPVKPVWWTREVDESLLGNYSPAKYKYFLRNVAGAEELDENMIINRPDQARKLVLEFKKWLYEQNPKIYDDDNYEYMSVKV